jgi:HAD superfamily hydrolase (TIGR01509 family)
MDPEEVAVDKRNAFLKHLDDIVRIDEVADFALSLRGKFPLAIATGGSRLVSEKVLQQVGMSDLFDEVVTANDVVCGKPAPDIYKEAASRLGVDPLRCLAFEDAAAGMMAAQSAGMRVVCVPAPVRVK